MFTKLETLKKFNENEFINIYELFELVKFNPKSSHISRIREVEYKSKEYNDLKLRLPSITPHGVFRSLKSESLIKLSGYLYFDIDGINEIENIKQKLIDTNIVSFICKSVGGRGLSFLVKYDTFNIGNDTFIDLYNYVRDIFVNLGFNIDMSAGGLVRKMIISSDSDVYLNDKVSLPINVVSIKDAGKSNDIKKIEKKRERDIKGNDTFKKLILIDENRLNIKTKSDIEVNGDFEVKEVEYYNITEYKIKDGDKHRVYIRIINALYYLNNNITKDEVYSFLYYYNMRQDIKMDNYQLMRLVWNISSNIEKTGDVRIKLGKKKIHISDKYNKKQKEIMGGKINGKLRQNESIRLINEAREKCFRNNEIPTQKKIADMTGLGIATVKRNWKKEITNINDIKVDDMTMEKEIQIIRESKISQIEEIDSDLFFSQKEMEKINYKGIKIVEIEKVTTEDKRLFISKINEVKDIYGDVLESHIQEMNLWSKEKTWYLYDKWRNKNEYSQINREHI